MELIDWLVKYWLQVLFGLICGGVTIFVRRYIKLWKDTKERDKDDLLESIQDKMDNQYVKTQEQMDDCYRNLTSIITQQGEEMKAVDAKLSEQIVAVKRDVLAIEGAYFRSECRRLLQKDHIITNEEFNTITIEHTAYNSLGGNHEGDALYAMIEEKHKEYLIEREKENMGR